MCVGRRTKKCTHFLSAHPLPINETFLELSCLLPGVCPPKASLSLNLTPQPACTPQRPPGTRCVYIHDPRVDGAGEALRPSFPGMNTAAASCVPGGRLFFFPDMARNIDSTDVRYMCWCCGRLWLCDPILRSYEGCEDCRAPTVFGRNAWRKCKLFEVDVLLRRPQKVVNKRRRMLVPFRVISVAVSLRTAETGRNLSLRPTKRDRRSPRPLVERATSSLRVFAPTFVFAAASEPSRPLRPGCPGGW